MAGERAFSNQDPIAHKLMPGITLKGALHMFYKIPVTTQPARSVALGVYPAEPTTVYAHFPAVPRPLAVCVSAPNRWITEQVFLCTAETNNLSPCFRGTTYSTLSSTSSNLRQSYHAGGSGYDSLP